MNRRQLLSLAVLPFVPKTLNAVAPADKPMSISGFGKYVKTPKRKDTLVFWLNAKNCDRNLIELLQEVFSDSTKYDLCIDWGSVAEARKNPIKYQKELAEYDNFVKDSMYNIHYSTKSKELFLLVFDGTNHGSFGGIFKKGFSKR